MSEKKECTRCQCEDCRIVRVHQERLVRTIKEMKSDLTRKDRWNHLEAFLEVWERKLRGKWSWGKNMDCKYIGLWIDMRDGGCIIQNKDQKTISPSDLAYQYKFEDSL